MIVLHRRNKIKEILIKERSVRVAELAQKFNVSEETIRRDLNQLEREGLVKKNYGGAVLVEELQQSMNVIPPLSQRKFQFFEEKEAIGKLAASHVHDEEIVILDAGSTTWSVSRYLKEYNNLTVVTNGINICEELSQTDDSSIFMLGGKLQKKSMSLVGPQAEWELQKYNADIAFLGTSGISLRKGFTSSDIYEAEVKRAIIAAAQKVVIVADHSKFNRQGLMSFSSFSDIDVLITSSQADPEMLEAIRGEGVEVHICPFNVKKSEESV